MNGGETRSKFIAGIGSMEPAMISPIHYDRIVLRNSSVSFSQVIPVENECQSPKRDPVYKQIARFLLQFSRFGFLRLEAVLGDEKSRRLTAR
jgi:hypothetical protein